METLRVSHDEREMKLKSTLAQHSKLIDFLQAKTEVKKKTTLTDKLFGSHKKENQSSIPLAYRDMENQLQKKNVQVRDLNEQLAKCRAELAATKSTDSTKPSVLSEQARNTSATPLPYRALSKLTQSPGTQVCCLLFFHWHFHFKIGAHVIFIFYEPYTGFAQYQAQYWIG